MIRRRLSYIKSLWTVKLSMLILALGAPVLYGAFGMNAQELTERIFVKAFDDPVTTLFYNSSHFLFYLAPLMAQLNMTDEILYHISIMERVRFRKNNILLKEVFSWIGLYCGLYMFLQTLIIGVFGGGLDFLLDALSIYLALVVYSLLLLLIAYFVKDHMNFLLVTVLLLANIFLRSPALISVTSSTSQYLKKNILANILYLFILSAMIIRTYRTMEILGKD